MITNEDRWNMLFDMIDLGHASIVIHGDSSLSTRDGGDEYTDPGDAQDIIDEAIRLRRETE